MLSCFDFAREMDLLAVTVRMVAAFLCGAVIGLEREHKRRPAGFRTHILICLGASMATLTNLYLYQVMHLFTDVARIGAQVVAGMGFIGAGTIIVTKRQRVKGLTTAAGLWTSAIIGLVCGAGYIECAIFATVMVMVAELLLIKLEYRFARLTRDMSMYIEYEHSSTIDAIIKAAWEHEGEVDDLEIVRRKDTEGGHRYYAMLAVRSKGDDQSLIDALGALDGVISVQALR